MPRPGPGGTLDRDPIGSDLRLSITPMKPGPSSRMPEAGVPPLAGEIAAEATPGQGEAWITRRGPRGWDHQSAEGRGRSPASTPGPGS